MPDENEDIRSVVREELERDRERRERRPEQDVDDAIRAASRRGKHVEGGPELPVIEPPDATPDWSGGARGSRYRPPKDGNAHFRALLRAAQRRRATRDEDYWDEDDPNGR